MTGGHVHGGGPPATPGQVSPARLIATLGGVGALAGALILVVFAATSPAIEAHRAQRIDAAIREVLRGPERYDTLYVSGSTLTTETSVGAEPVYLGRDASGAATGYAIVAAAPGFADIIRVIFGYDPATKTVLGMKVLESKETPGLGDLIEKDSAWVSQFVGALAPLRGVKSGRGTGSPAEIDLITGATISSRAIVRIINDALDRLGPALRSGTAVVP